ncbi:MAG TPA: TIGR02996 domain-containing protein [Gemmata sp.]
MNERAGFLAAILENPADDAPRLAYADWLRERDDPFDRLHGRFIAAGLVLHHMREPVVGNEGPYYDAIRDASESGLQVLGLQLGHLLGWKPGAWAWDNDTDRPGRIAARLIPPKSEGPSTVRERRARRRTPAPVPAVIWERGCVTAARLSAAQWLARGGVILRHCPLERVELIEVPGLELRVVNESNWRLVGELSRPHSRWRVDSVALHPVQAPEPSLLFEGTPREALVEQLAALTGQVLTRLHFLAGFAWPGPLPETLMNSNPTGA